MMTRTRVSGHNLFRSATAATLLLGVAAAASAQDSGRWSWSRQMEAGHTIEIKGINGRIRAVPASGDQVSVTAEKRGRRDNADDVKIEVVEHAGDVTICAVYPTPRGARRRNECKPGEGGHMNVRNNDVKVDFTVHVPARIALTARTVNGDIEAKDLGSRVEAHTVNGGVTLSTRGLAEARTVNGSIVAKVGTSRLSDALDFRTVNGSIQLDVPAGLDASVSFSVVNGGISSDFPMTVSGRFGPKHMEGTIGGGGPRLSAETVNGSIELRKI